MRPLPPLNPLLTFEVAARHLSFTKAAHELNVSQGAVSHQIAVLEEYFGKSLFERSSTGIALTSDATFYATALRAAFDELRNATANYLTATSRITLTIKGYPLFLSRWLTPRLPAFSRQFSNIDVRLVSTSGASLVDFAKESVDIGIRYGNGRWRGLASYLLFPDELVPICTKELAESLDLRSPRNLAGKVLLQTHARSSDWPDWFSCAGIAGASALRQVKSFEDLGIVHRFALEGSGIAIIQKAYVQEDIDERRLIIPCEPVLRRNFGYYLIYPADRVKVPKIKIFQEWLLNSGIKKNMSGGTFI
jgi:LysR family glycine cleavage system transcriptional activator